jgi:hypothetical protein
MLDRHAFCEVDVAALKMEEVRVGRLVVAATTAAQKK